MAQAPLSPSSSPRLPSPPPFPEVQIGPKSPGLGAPGDSAAQDAETAAKMNIGATRRIRPGTKAVDMASGPPLVPLSELDSSFQLQEHLKALYLHATRSENDQATGPITRDSATMLSTPPDGVDRALWLYELCRLLVQRANSLIVGFFADNPPCSAQNCPEMRASEWQYLCAVHDPPKSCCAIDYCCHTLDWAANVLTSQKHFPSRLSLGGDAPGGTQASVRQLTNIFRRVYRMFAHAWFQHRDVFWALEGQEGLYIFYKTVCDVYQLVPEENYTVPSEAEGILPPDVPAVKVDADTSVESDAASSTSSTGTSKLAEPAPSTEGELSTSQLLQEGSGATTLGTGATTRRHKQTPSVGSFVTTIAEGDEDGEDRKGVTQVGEQPSAKVLSETVGLEPSSSSPEKAASAPSGSVPEAVDEGEKKAKDEGKGEEVKRGEAPIAEAADQTLVKGEEGEEAGEEDKKGKAGAEEPAKKDEEKAESPAKAEESTTAVKQEEQPEPSIPPASQEQEQEQEQKQEEKQEQEKSQEKQPPSLTSK